MKNKITKIGLAVLLVVAALGLFQFLYIAPMTPMMREMYTNVGNYERVGHWTLDTTKTARKYFFPGMSKEEALAVMKKEECELGRHPTKPNRLSCYRRIKAAWMGIRLPFFNTYKMVIILDVEENKVESIKSVINLETIYG